MKFKAQTKAGTFLDWLRAIRIVSDDCVFDTSELDAVDVRVVDPAWDLLEVEAGHLGIDSSHASSDSVPPTLLFFRTSSEAVLLSY